MYGRNTIEVYVYTCMFVFMYGRKCVYVCMFVCTCMYIEPQKKRRNFNNSIRYGKQSIYFFSLNYKFLLQNKVSVLITKS